MQTPAETTHPTGSPGINAEDITSCVASVLSQTFTGGTMSVEEICAAMFYNRWTSEVTDALRTAVTTELTNLQDHGFITEEPAGRWAMSQQLVDMLID